jgi:hypothetical protein
MCGCSGAATPAPSQEQFEVRLPTGETYTVNSEHEARVAITRAGGGDFSRK